MLLNTIKFYCKSENNHKCICDKNPLECRCEIKSHKCCCNINPKFCLFIETFNYKHSHCCDIYGIDKCRNKDNFCEILYNRNQAKNKLKDISD